MNAPESKYSYLPTVEQLESQFRRDIEQAQSHLDSLKKFKYESRPGKPFLKRDHTSEDLKKYQTDFEEYEKKVKEWEVTSHEYRLEGNEILTLLEDYVKEVSGFNRLVPDDKKGKVWSKAWSDGHSSGYYSVYQELCELVDLFN